MRKAILVSRNLMAGRRYIQISSSDSLERRRVSLKRTSSDRKEALTDNRCAIESDERPCTRFCSAFWMSFSVDVSRALTFWGAHE